MMKNESSTMSPGTLRKFRLGRKAGIALTDSGVRPRFEPEMVSRWRLSPSCGLLMRLLRFETESSEQFFNVRLVSAGGQEKVGIRRGLKRPLI